ncbi:hypothetical protein P43SY_009422 [Pythium insidiosum]|uniref:inositol-phosphate phosphatase n=1 Tax=Pythium insidiosum TaxID=114742 RepID=A0AAD5LNC0_PYTIN|nr:hypothetical protein P43SY_009422 [Pythium insidiosum]
MAESPTKRARATTTLDAVHDVAVKAARAAGAHMKAQLLTAAVEKTKSSKDDLVTVVDKQCQDLVFSTIKEVFPSHEFLGEESVEPGSDASARALREMQGKEWLWIVDPIDGTTNFVHHRPSSVVSVACAHRGEVVVGVIYDPYRDELFAAQRGKGTTLNGKAVRVSPEATFGEALVGFGIGTKDSVRLPMLDCVRELSAQCRGIRLQGAAAIELAWTACGRQTAFYELDLNSWDIAAGSLLVAEAGGRVSDSAGQPFSLSTRNIVVSNGQGDVHATLLALIKKADAVHVRKLPATPDTALPIPSSPGPFDHESTMAPALLASPPPPTMAMTPPPPPASKVNTWFFMCGPLSLNVFLFGLALNLHVFKRYDMAVDKVLDMRRDELPTARGVAQVGGALLALQLTLFGLQAWCRGDRFGVDEVQMELLLVLYCFAVAMLLLCPFDVMHRKCRYFVVHRLARCLWPFQGASLALPSHPTPFVEVFLADGLTSLSKFIQDAAVAWMLLSLSFSQQELSQLRHAYVTKMKASPLPYFAASMPYVIRATQCLISFRRTSSANDRFLHLLNTLKYCSSLLVISVGAYPQVMGLRVQPERHSFFLLCAVFNSLYSFLWDVIMDWGLGQPGLPRRVAFLRHQLLYRPRPLYYVVIAVDFVLRILWVTKWWDWELLGVDFKMLSMIAEVLRRCMWNFVRVEWQCIKLEILGTKKLSEDSMELEQSLEGMPLMDEDDDDQDAHDDCAVGDEVDGERADDEQIPSPHAELSASPLSSLASSLSAPVGPAPSSRHATASASVVRDQSKPSTTHHRKAILAGFDDEEERYGLLSVLDEP